jgi:uncharacterized protein (TIGR03083 family)
VPKLIADIIVAGTLGATDQPVLSIDDELELRPFVVGDVETVVTAFSTPDIQFFHFRHLDHDEALEWIEQCANAWRSEKSATWAIVDRRTVRVLGRVTIHLSLGNGHGEVSYWVLPDGRSRGVAPRACVAATMWAHSIGLHRVELQHSTTNTASRRVALRAGFREEGVRREALLHADGWHDMVLYSHLASDLPASGDARTSSSPALETPDSDVEGCARAHARIRRVAARLSDPDMRQPSNLPGWSVGHVLTHLARNAESMCVRIGAATHGELVEQYPDGADGREAAIATGATRSCEAIVADLDEWCVKLDALFVSMPSNVWNRPVRTVAGGDHPVSLLPFRRWREVEVHLVDLGIGYSPQEWSQEFVDRAFPRLLTGLGKRADHRDVMAWLLGRGPAPQVDPWG